MTLTRNALDELLDTLLEQLAQRLAGRHLDPLDLALWLERRIEVIRGFAAPDDRDYLEERLADALPREDASRGGLARPA
jgi:hypothetical protein